MEGGGEACKGSLNVSIISKGPEKGESNWGCEVIEKPTFWAHDEGRFPLDVLLTILVTDSAAFGTSRRGLFRLQCPSGAPY